MEVKIKALVVDDNEVNILILINLLETLGISADQASSGLQAVEMVGKKNYDIVFVDHIMPVMDGLQTTAFIRKIYGEQSNTIIIAVTSTLTEEIRTLYQKTGANGVYEKPLGFIELNNILKKWYPHLYMDCITKIKTETNELLINNYIQKMVEEIEEINYQIGLNYTNGNPLHYINILKVSLKDMQSCRNTFKQNLENDVEAKAQHAVHKLKSIFSIIGADELREEAKNIEQNISQNVLSEKEKNCNLFFARVESLQAKLQLMLEKIDKFLRSLAKQKEELCNPMQKHEYEQSLLNTIYYSERFEYDLIIKELEDLILRGQPEYQKEYEQAIQELHEFNYEKVMKRMLKIKNEIGF